MGIAMNLTDKLLWQIENHLFKPITLGDLARHCAVSKFHMVRSFRQSTGFAPMTYLRVRRLTEAAQLLAAGEQDILGIALDLQYQSHEAFTRAFSAHFGVQPIAIRRARSTQTLSLTRPIQMTQNMITDLAPPQIQDRPAFRVTGLGIDSTVEDTSNIPPLWQSLARAFQTNDIDPNICTYGVCTDTNDVGNFRYVAGLEPKRDFSAPKGFETVDIPANTYAVFTHKGHIADIGKSTYTLWNKSLPEAGLTAKFAPSFERYDSRFDPVSGRGEVEIWVPIET